MGDYTQNCLWFAGKANFCCGKFIYWVFLELLTCIWCCYQGIHMCSYRSNNLYKKKFVHSCHFIFLSLQSQYSVELYTAWILFVVLIGKILILFWIILFFQLVFEVASNSTAASPRWMLIRLAQAATPLPPCMWGTCMRTVLKPCFLRR